MGLDQYFEVFYRKPDIKPNAKFSRNEYADIDIDNFDDADKICSKLKALKYAVPITIEIQHIDCDKAFADKLAEQGYKFEDYTLVACTSVSNKPLYIFYPKEDDLNEEKSVKIYINDEDFDPYKYWKWEELYGLCGSTKLNYFCKNYFLQAYMKNLGYNGRNCYYMYVSEQDLKQMYIDFPEFAQRYYKENKKDEKFKWMDTRDIKCDVDEVTFAIEKALKEYRNNKDIAIAYYEWF